MNKEISTCIQARLSSKRLPGKMLMKIQDKTVIQFLFDRLKKSKLCNSHILATTNKSIDNELETIALENNFSCFRGSENDVLARVCNALNLFKPKIVVEICGDCPFIDPFLIDYGIKTFLEKKPDVLFCGYYKQWYPIGTDFAIYDTQTILEVEKNTQNVEQREHTSLFFLQNKKKFKIINLENHPSLKFPELRLVLDYPEDLLFINKIYKEIKKNDFGTKDVIDLVKKKSFLMEINKKIKN